MFIEEQLDDLKERLNEAEVKIAELLNIASLPEKAGARVISIQSTIAAEYGFTLAQIRSESRSGELIWPRFLTYYIARKVTGQTFAHLAHKLGRGDPGTIAHGCKYVADRMEVAPKDKAEVEKWLNIFKPKPTVGTSSTSSPIKPNSGNAVERVPTKKI